MSKKLPPPIKGKKHGARKIVRRHAAESGNASKFPVWFHLVKAIMNKGGSAKLSDVAPSLEKFSNRKGGIGPVLGAIATHQRPDYFKQLGGGVYSVTKVGKIAVKELRNA